MGYIVSVDGILIDFEKIKVIELWFELKFVGELRSFFGICVYYRCFIKFFSDIVKFLFKFIEKDFVFCWFEEC